MEAEIEDGNKKPLRFKNADSFVLLQSVFDHSNIICEGAFKVTNKLYVK